MFVIKIIVGIFSLFQGGYEDNIKFIEDHNSLKNTSYEVGINEFINRTYINGTTNDTSHYIPSEHTMVNILSDKKCPKHVDWRKEGAISSVKNQLDCGSCWAFSASEAIEGEWYLKYNQLYNLSEQELVDCSGYLGNMGCGGGSMDAAFEYVIQNGLCLNQSYPYNATNGLCQNQTCTKKVHIDKYYDVPHNNEKQLERAVVQQPVSVAIQANLRSFQLYKKGIYSDPDCGDQLDHGVLLVGYGYDPELDMKYWIVKNSWGDNWGENGYIRIAKDIENPEGQCGIAMDASYPITGILI
jgi:C1A family cysteine protease